MQHLFQPENNNIPYYPYRLTLRCHGAHWDSGPSLCQAVGELGAAAGERWPSWSHWPCSVWIRPWSSSSSLPSHLRGGGGEDAFERYSRRKSNCGAKINYKPMRAWDGAANYGSCFCHVTNGFFSRTQFEANIRRPIHLDLGSNMSLEKHTTFQTSFEWKGTRACRRSC